MAPEAPEPNELAFLCFFFKEAGKAMGPADGEIYQMIAEDFEAESGERIPPPYRERCLGDEEEDYEYE